MPRDVACPNPSCGKTFQVPEGAVGYTVRCPHCNAKIHLSPSPSVPAAQAGVSSLPPPPVPVVDANGEPKKIGRFEITEKLGSAGFGDVYRGQDVQSRAPAFLHVIHRNRAKSSQFVDHFLERAKVAAKLHHPRIALLREAGCDGSFYYIVSDYVSERNLEHALAKGPMPSLVAARMARELAEALAYGHGLGITHREVRPANIWLDDQGGAHLIGFGLAHWQDLAEHPNREESFQAALPYLAPELAGGEGKADQPASDQYSLGAVFYQMLTGQLPFSGPPVILLFNILRGEMPRPRELRADVPAELEDICLKAMARAPEDRYPGCAQLAEALAGWLQEQDGAVAPAPKRRVARLDAEFLGSTMIFTALGPEGRIDLQPHRPAPRAPAREEPAPAAVAASAPPPPEPMLAPHMEMDVSAFVPALGDFGRPQALSPLVSPADTFTGGPLSPFSSGFDWGTALDVPSTEAEAPPPLPEPPAKPPEPVERPAPAVRHPEPEVRAEPVDPPAPPAPPPPPAPPAAAPPRMPAPPPPVVSTAGSAVREVARSPLVRQFPRPVFGGTVTVRNTGREAVPGPFQVVLKDLPPGATLLNASGTTSAGEPYLVLQVEGLPPGRSLMAAVRFQKAEPLGLDEPIPYRTEVRLQS